jgi:hypothetical protein
VITSYYNGAINNYLVLIKEVGSSNVQMLCILGCIYLLQFKFGSFCPNSAKQTTALYVHYQGPLSVIENTITKVPKIQ